MYILVDELWKTDDVREMITENVAPMPKDGKVKEKLLADVLVLLVTVNDNENFAALSYLKPPEGHEDVYKYTDVKNHGTELTEAAVYFIGMYGACPTAIRKIKPGSNLHGGASTVPRMAYNCFANLCVIIGVGVACGVEKKAKMCDVLISEKVTNYDQARVQSTGELPRGTTVLASEYLYEEFNQFMQWPSPKSKLHKYLQDVGFDCMPRKKIGVILSGPYLIDDPDVKQQKIDTFAPEAIGIEMEAAYLFAAAKGAKTDVTIVKAVCDFGDGKKNKVFQPTAAILAADLVHTVLDDPNTPDVLKRKGLLCYCLM